MAACAAGRGRAKGEPQLGTDGSSTGLREESEGSDGLVAPAAAGFDARAQVTLALLNDKRRKGRAAPPRQRGASELVKRDTNVVLIFDPAAVTAGGGTSFPGVRTSTRVYSG